MSFHQNLYNSNSNIKVNVFIEITQRKGNRKL